MSSLTISGLVKRYGSTEVLHGLDLSIEGNEFVVFVGPSGCGKSTFLRSIAGLEDINEGKITLDDREISSLEPDQRGVAMVFQNYALYPHMTVRANMGFGLKMAGVDKSEIARKVDAAAETLQVTPYLDRKPADLSGGQRQRVAIGRAIVRDPDVFLFDEPLSNLDADLRAHMRLEIVRLHRRQKGISIYVTHDQVEAMTMADRIVVMRDGYIEQVGSPLELYNNPANEFVAGFLGTPKMNFIQAETKEGKIVLNDEVLETDHVGLPASGPIKLGVRPDAWSISKDGPGLLGEVLHAEQLGRETVIVFALEDGARMSVIETGQSEIRDGETLRLLPDAKRMFAFDADGLTYARGGQSS